MELILDYLQFDPERYNSGFCVGGALYLSFSDSCFPDENWYDMPFEDLSAWLPGLISFGMNHTDFCQLSFMDGPYTAQIRRLAAGRIVVSCLHDHKQVISDREIDFKRFVRSVMICCRQFDRFLHENTKKNIFSEEIKQLKSILLLKT